MRLACTFRRPRRKQGLLGNRIPKEKVRDRGARLVRQNENDNAVPFAPQLCCPKSLTNSERAVVKGGADCRSSYYETFASRFCLLHNRFGGQCAGQRHAEKQ
jgi:hypothetical protein